MSLNDLLVHMDNGAECRSRLATAVGLAVSHEAHLTGLFVITRPYIPTYMEVQLGPEILEAEAEAAAAAAAKVETVFRDAAEKAGIAHEWRLAEGEVVDTVALHARYSDVAVVGQRNPDGVFNEGIPDRLVLSVGRPVLVVPYIGDYPTVGRRVMIAWDGSRLATRAVHDAMPFLLKAGHVTVMAVNPITGPEDHGAVPGADLCRHLARHGINAEAKHIAAEDIEVGDMLLSRAADAGIDLLVMGAYGHARWRELVLGGVTRHMLKHMTMPVLMSH